MIVSGDIESISVETVLEAMRRAGAADVTPMLRAEAEYVWKLIASRYDAIRAPDTPVPRVALTESAIWGVGTSSMRTSTHVPRVFTALAWVAFVTGWLVIALLTWRSVVAARERSATSLNPLQFDQ